MGRPILDEQHIHPAARDKVATLHVDIVKGALVGGASDLQKLLESGALKT